MYSFAPWVSIGARSSHMLCKVPIKSASSDANPTLGNPNANHQPM
jgi:hypothetical protein